MGWDERSSLVKLERSKGSRCFPSSGNEEWKPLSGTGELEKQQEAATAKKTTRRLCPVCPVFWVEDSTFTTRKKRDCP